MHPMLNIAVRIARQAGNLMFRNLGEAAKLTVEEKHRDDLVTNMDRECEEVVRQGLLKSYPGHCVLGEEGGTYGNADSPYRWYVDPIDGTTNFVRGIGHCAVSMALRKNDRPEVAVVFDPQLNEMFTAARGEGAMLNGHRIRVSARETLEGAIIGTAFPVRYRERMDAYMPLFRRLIDSCADVRRMGAASLDMCYVACGRFDGYLEQGLKSWDFAAGELIVQEAGGMVTDFAGTNRYRESGNVVCGNSKVLKHLMTVCDPQSLSELLR